MPCESAMTAVSLATVDEDGISRSRREASYVFGDFLWKKTGRKPEAMERRIHGIFTSDFEMKSIFLPSIIVYGGQRPIYVTSSIRLFFTYLFGLRFLSEIELL